MKHINLGTLDVARVGLGGMGMSAAAMILCAGASGKRLALPSAKIMIHQGSAGTRGAPSDMEIQLREVLSTTTPSRPFLMSITAFMRILALTATVERRRRGRQRAAPMDLSARPIIRD